MSTWSGPDSAIAATVAHQNKRLLQTYQADPKRLEEDANTERSIHDGAYAHRQLHELLQNAADAMRSGQGRCEVLLTDHTLYVANSGEPLTEQGVDTLMAAHLSSKRDEQIGRFGLGFKAVLAVTDTPKIYSRSGSLGFDRAWSRDQLSADIPGRPHYPAARLAQSLDPLEARREDPVLRGLMAWATTVVVLPHLMNRAMIAKSLKGFPAEFLLFSQHVTQLDLEDRPGDVARRITLGRDDDGLLRLDDAGKKTTWVVASRSHAPSGEALRDGGYQASRDVIDLTWAAPVSGVAHRVGSCWAYFPTEELTTLSGIVNAPWKLNDDRSKLLPGPFNDELLTEVLPGLVSSSLRALTRPSRPAAGLDALPARGKETRGYADKVLGQPVINAVAAGPCIPNMNGALRHPSKVRLHPKAADPEDLELWASACPDPEWWVHHGVTGDERRSKALRLMAIHKRGETPVKEWVEHIAASGTVEGSAAAVRIVAAMTARDPELRQALARARVLLLEDGTLDAPRRGQVFLPGGATSEGQRIINRTLAADSDVERALKDLGIEIFNDAGSLRIELAKSPIPWDRVWRASRRVDEREAEQIFRDVFGDELVSRIRAYTRSGKLKSPAQVFLPGEVIPAGASRDADFVVDHRFHSQDLDLLAALGFVGRPLRLVSAPDESWREAFRQRMHDQYRNETRQPKLADERIDVDEGRVLWPLGFLPRLSLQGRLAVTHCALLGLEGDERWRITQVGGGSSFSAPDPVWRRITKHGALETEAGVQPVERCLTQPIEDIDPIDRACLPYLTSTVTDDQARALHLKADLEELSDEDWYELIDEAAGWTSDRRFQLYAWAAFYEQAPPDRIKVDRGRGFVEVPPDKAAVTSRDDVYDSLITAGEPVLKTTTPEDAEHLVHAWGLAVGEDMLSESVSTVLSGEKYRALDRFPPLENDLEIRWHALDVQPCSRIELLTRTPGGEKSRSLTARLDDEQGVLFTTAQTDQDVLRVIAQETETRIVPTNVLRRMEKQRLSQLVTTIADTDDLLQKLVLAVGSESLTSSIPAAALSALRSTIGRRLDDYEIARLALAIDGYEVLQKHRAALASAGLEPPSQWAGRGPARSWVRQLNFPVEFAGFTGSEREAEIEAEGPPELGDLHLYQERIAERIKQLFDVPTQANRGLVSLPTGAGKTRVAVQAIVEHMACVDDDVRVVWLAETDELCEQAVQTWWSIWRAFGRPGAPLSINRLWSSNHANERDGLQVVVASAAKLASIVSDSDWADEYGWLRRPDLIVVDEAHRSIVKQYNQILRALSDTRRLTDTDTPLLGLTATPFRGFNRDETDRLIKRYQRRLDEGVFDGEEVHAHLQQIGVLARVRQEELRGADITLTDAEKEDVDQFGQLSGRVTAELSEDEERNNTIVKSVLGLPETARVLLFATSTENARVLAALISYHGVEARAVDANTPKPARRRYIEDFKSGAVRILTNYSVFAEGFDVPAVDAVYITRPTFSPNVYQQMIGRGLRGPRNGGSEEVLIVNVADNLTNFGRKFAFHHFDHLWKGSR